MWEPIPEARIEQPAQNTAKRAPGACTRVGQFRRAELTCVLVELW